MKVIIKKVSQHGDITIIDGSKKQVLQALRIDARTKRLESRKRHKLPMNVGSINDNLHQSSLVTMSSYELENKGIDQLIALLNNHGITQYIN